MSTAQKDTPAQVEELLRAVDQLPTDQLEEFIEQALLLRTQRHVPHLPHDESPLMLKINESLPANTQQRYNMLKAKNRAGTLTPAEHEEFLQLIAQVEGLNVQRVEALAALARLRGTTLRGIMDSLGIRPPAYE
jgi:hypothetical protein